MADPHVMKILESEVYTGDLVQGKTKIVDHQQVKAGEDNLIIAKCTHEPIISHELFNAVQEYRKQICEESKATPNVPTHQTFSKVKCSVLIVAEAFTGNAPSAGKDPTLTGSTALQTAG